MHPGRYERRRRSARRNDRRVRENKCHYGGGGKKDIAANPATGAAGEESSRMIRNQLLFRRATPQSLHDSLIARLHEDGWLRSAAVAENNRREKTIKSM